MLLDKILLQVPVAAPDTAAANKIKEATHVVTAQVDSLANQLHPDSIAAMTPTVEPAGVAGIAHCCRYPDLLYRQVYHQQDLQRGACHHGGQGV